MPKTYTLEEQLEALTPEQLEELKQELIKSRVEESGGTSVKGLLGRGAIRALSSFGEGAVLGLQGRPISEGSFMKKPGSPTAELEEFLLKERLKNAISPSSILSQMELDEIKRKKLEQRKSVSQGVEISESPEDVKPSEAITPIFPKEETPPMFIKKPKGKNKYGIMEYETIENPEYKLYEKKQEKVIEFDVKKEQLKKDLESFFAVDDLIDRAKGGFVATRGAGLTSQYRAIAQPVTKEGKPDIKGTAARVHDAAVKRLRVQLVRAAGDVGNINIVEQEAAEKLIPGFYDSESAAQLKRAYLTEISKAIKDKDANAVKAILDKAGIGYIEIGKTSTQPINNQPDEYQRYLQSIGAQ